MKYEDTTEEQRQYYSTKKTVKGWRENLDLPVPNNITQELYKFMLKNKKVIIAVRHDPEFFKLLIACKNLMDSYAEQTESYNNFMKEQQYIVVEKKALF